MLRPEDVVPILIESIRLWDGVAETALDRAAALLDGETIVWAGPASDAPVAARDYSVERVNGGGGTLMPGLIDCHIHFTVRPDQQDILPYAPQAENARRALAVGLTSVRELGAPDHGVIAAARAIEAGEAEGPHIVAAGRPIAPPNGYMVGTAVEVAEPEGVRATVRAQIAAGAGVIKAIASPVPPVFDRAMPRSFGVPNLTAAAEEAHAAGLRITAHAHGLEGARDAVAAGFDCIEHGYRLDSPTIAEMRSRGTWLVPTLVAMEAAQAPGWAPGRPDEEARRARERWEAAAWAAREAHRAGVPMAAGTDAIVIVPVHAIRREVTLLVDHAGMTPVEALRAATSRAAALLGIDGWTGRIAPGLSADLLLVDGDPLADGRVLDRVRGVWRRGRRVALAG